MGLRADADVCLEHAFTNTAKAAAHIVVRNALLRGRQRLFTPDGWLRTGDMGLVDARGYFKITDRKKDMTLTEPMLLAHCRQHLTGYKVPKIVEFRTEALPRTNVGKILRRQLREPANDAPMRVNNSMENSNG